MGAALAAARTLRERTPEILRDGGMLARLTRDLPGFLGHPADAAGAAGVVKLRLERREQELLGMLRQAIYGNPRSPYRQLLEAAGCELGDVRALVAQHGIEGALTRLADAGVYLSYEEFKGRAPVVRGSRRFAFDEHDFDNPAIRPHFEVRTGGTTGRSVTIRRSLAFVADQALDLALVLRAHGLERAEQVIWMTAGVTHLLRYARLGITPGAWFYPVKPVPPTVRAGSLYLSLLSRALGHGIPAPRYFDLRDAAGMAHWLAERVRRGRPVCVSTYPSSAARVAAAAAEHGLDLTGVWFDIGGEPFTPAKLRALEAVGAKTMQLYALMEAGIVGYGCATPAAPDDLHLLADSHVLARRRRAVGLAGGEVDAFLLTVLLPSAAKIMLNVENGDFGEIEERPCGCELGALGLTTHLSYVRSFEKLTGEGVAFVRTDLVPLLEEVLPARFGGTSADYQLLEEEDGQGVMRLYLLVGPRVGPVDDEAVRAAFLAGLSPQGGIEQLSADVWERAGTVRVRRQEPVANGVGKVLPFYFARRPQAVNN